MVPRISLCIRPRPSAVVIPHHLAQGCARCESRHPDEGRREFRVTLPAAEERFLGVQDRHVPGGLELFAKGVGGPPVILASRAPRQLRESAKRSRAVGVGHAREGVLVIDRDGERAMPIVLEVLPGDGGEHGVRLADTAEHVRHEGQANLAGDVPGQGDADEAACFLPHRSDRCGGDELARDDEIRLFLPTVSVVDEHEPSRLQGVHGGLDFVHDFEEPMGVFQSYCRNHLSGRHDARRCPYFDGDDGSPVLDPPALAHLDPSGMRDIVAALPDQLMDGRRRGGAADVGLERADRVFLLGMGGSGIAGEVFAAWAADRSRVPIQPVHDYRLPAHASSGDALVAISYSGNTEETIAAVSEGIKLGCRLVAVTSGGALANLARDAGAPVIEIPRGFPPRGTFGYQFGVLARLGRSWILGDSAAEFDRAVDHLHDLRGRLSPETGVRRNPAKALASRLRDRIPIVYGAPPLGPIAKRWQTQFNENAKVLAFSSLFPEADHNEIIGWCSDARAGSLAPIFLRDSDESPEMRWRLDASAALFSRKTRVEQPRDEAPGLLARLLGLLYLGDYTSLYLAALRKVDPMPVAPIDELKARLRRRRKS